MCTEIEMVLIQKEENMTKLQVNKNIFFVELSSKPNVDIIVITLYMCKIYDFETIFISNDVMNIQDGVRKGSGSREIA